MYRHIRNRELFLYNHDYDIRQKKFGNNAQNPDFQPDGAVHSDIHEFANIVGLLIPLPFKGRWSFQ
jgi:hypothetical protein